MEPFNDKYFDRACLFLLLVVFIIIICNVFFGKCNAEDWRRFNPPVLVEITHEHQAFQTYDTITAIHYHRLLDGKVYVIAVDGTEIFCDNINILSIKSLIVKGGMVVERIYK